MRKETSHPAYGLAAFHRVSGHPGNLFGSSVDCDQYVELEIKPAVESDDEFDRHYYDSGIPYITIALSPAQFADLITNMNIGMGIPCTILDRDGKDVERIPDDIRTNELDRQRENFKEKMKIRKEELYKSQDKIEEILSKPNLNKADKEELKRVLFRSIQDASSNIEFYMEQFQEATEGIVHEAKSEIDATVQHCVMSAGLKALGEEFKNQHKQIEDAEYQETEVQRIR